MSIRLPAAFVVFIAVSAAGVAQENQQGEQARPLGSYVSISGTVASVMPDGFVLDFRDGDIAVEMDEDSRDAEAYELSMGDRVTVFGPVDDDFFESRRVEASAIYVEKLGTYFRNRLAAEAEYDFVTVSTPVDPPSIVVQGEVTHVNGSRFTVDTGSRSFRVDVGRMSYNPVDDEGYQSIQAGDLVSVSAPIEDDFLEGRTLYADSVTSIYE